MMNGNFFLSRVSGCIAILFLAGLTGLYAQDVSWAYSDGTPIDSGSKPAEKAPPEVLSRHFRDLQLGMGLDDLKTALAKDSYFNFRGDRDVSLLPAREQSLVETTGSLFIKRAFFQLREGKLFTMAFTMDTNQIDHYSIFTHFVQKYGEPTSLSPKESVWENDDTRIAIERPLTIKYIDKHVFNDIINESAVDESAHVWLRQDFINEF